MLLDHFEKDDQLFAAQCIWWLTSKIKFTEILIYYRHYRILPSDYVHNLDVSPLPERAKVGSMIQGSQIQALDINESEIESSSGLERVSPIAQRNQCKLLHLTRFRRDFNNKSTHSNLELQSWFGK